MGGFTDRQRTGAGGFTKIELLVVISIIALGIGILLPALEQMGRRSGQMPTSNQVRGIHQSMVINAQNNNGYLAGIDKSGEILKAGDAIFGGVKGNTRTGASFSGRYYVLLNGGFIEPKVLINKMDSMPKTKKGRMPEPSEFSFALLRIGESARATVFDEQAGRATEWRDNANSQAILIADRNTSPLRGSDQVRSVWSTSKSGADWKGTVLWGDNHAEFLNATHARLGTLSLNTKYAGEINSDDFLFGSDDAPGKVGTASAMFGYTTENF